MIDCHLHTSFSGDGEVSPHNMILKAIDLGIKHIAITDHMDIDGATIGVHPHLPHNVGKYLSTLSSLKQKYRDRIYVAVGVEAGWSKGGEALTKQIIDSNPFEYIINAIHTVDGIDCYHTEYFLEQAKLGRGRDEVYNRYYETILESLDAPYPFHAVAHLDYIVRNAPYADKIYKYCEFAPILDRLLNKIICLDKILEYNTTSYTTPLVMPQVFERYYALGGRKITFASDSHYLHNIAKNYNDAARVLKNIGFEYFTVLQDGKQIRFLI